MVVDSVEPLPPPVDVIVENTELLPLSPLKSGLVEGAAPPPPTVTGYDVAVTGKAATQAPKGLLV